MKALKSTASVLLIVGGLNWLSIGLIGTDVVALLGSSIAKIAYILVGLSAIVEIIGLFSKGDQASI